MKIFTVVFLLSSIVVTAFAQEEDDSFLEAARQVALGNCHYVPYDASPDFFSTQHASRPAEKVKAPTAQQRPPKNHASVTPQQWEWGFLSEIDRRCYLGGADLWFTCI